MYVQSAGNGISDKGLMQKLQVIALNGAEVHRRTVFEWLLDANRNGRSFFLL
jgi:hypothetical protein